MAMDEKLSAVEPGFGRTVPENSSSLPGEMGNRGSSAAITELRRRLSIYWRRFTRRSDSEHEQALVRFGIVLLVLVYMLFSHRGPDHYSPTEVHVLRFLSAFLIFSVGVVLAIAIRPKKSPLRRVIGMIADLGGTTYVMSIHGETASPMYVILLWVTFGNGFRYGRKYLFASTLASTAGFALVIHTGSYWRSHLTLAGGLLLGLIVLPGYISTLLKKLTEAINRAEEANRAKSQFLANMSHEMRTPLSGILGMTDLVKDTQLNFEQKDFIQTIHASACMMLSLVEDVLDISKIEAGKMTIEKVDFDLHSLVKSSAAMLAPQAQAKGLCLSTQFSPQVPFLLRGDPLHVRQVILNLLGNAIKFTMEGEVCLRVKRIQETDASVTVKIEVTDTGIGISPEAQCRIFKRFTQADESITRRYGGTGLGTTIAKELVELMGGEIGVRSELGAGSTFWFTVELERQLASDSLEAGKCVLGDNRVLVVSAQSLHQETLQGYLSSWGIGAISVGKAAQAFAHLVSASNRGEPFHIAIVVDQYLDMDPFEFAKAIKSDGTIKQVQLILASTQESEMDWDRLTKHGFSSTVRVPVDKTMLFNAIHFSRPNDSDGSGILSLASRYLQKMGEWRGLDILVAEDNLTNQKVIGKILERIGHRTCLVQNGEQALDAMEKQSFDLVLMDLNMPVMGGLEAAKLYRFTHMHEPRVPIIALTADATPEARKACEEAGIDAYLTKPIETKRLLELIGSLAPAKTRSGGGEVLPHISPIQEFMPEPLGERPVIDTYTFQELEKLGGNSRFIEELVHVFLRTGEETVKDIERALLTQNAREARERAHALIGNAGQIGAISLVKQCSKFSRIESAELKTDGPIYLRGLKEEFARLREALIQRISKPGRAVS